MNTRTALTVPVTLALLALAGVLLSFGLDSYSLLVFTLCALSTVVGVGLNVLMGLSGQISFGHVAFYAIGAYVSALMTLAGCRCGWRCRPRAWPPAGRRAAGDPRAAGQRALPGDDHHCLRLRRAPRLIEWRDLTGGSNG